MKIYLLSFMLFGLGSLLANQVSADSFYITGLIKQIRVHEKTFRPVWADSLVFKLEGHTTVGACAKDADGYAMFVVQKTEHYMFSMLLTAFNENIPISINVIDTNLYNGHCFVDIFDLKK